MSVEEDQARRSMEQTLKGIELRARAQAVYDQNVQAIASAVGDVVTVWVSRTSAPRICVGDVAEAVLDLIEMMIAGTGDKRGIPGVCFEATLKDGIGGWWISIVAVINKETVATMEFKLDA